MTVAVEFDRVSIAFGSAPATALPLMDQGADRAEILTQTGQVLGVHDCSLRVDQGEILVLMGLSGSGKSTLLRAVNGLNTPIRGEVRVREGDRMVAVTGAGDKDLRRLRLHQISMVFQQFGLLPWRSVRENVALGLEFAGLQPTERRSRVDHQLDLVGLSQWADTKVTDLSGGMQQRVGLARALVTEAPILLMDEPFSALDPLIRSRLQQELLELQAQLKRTIIFVSHDLDEAFRLGSRIAILDEGRIVQCGTPRDILSNPATDHVASFLQDMNPLRVLEARDVMGPATGAAQGGIPADMPLRAVMARLGPAPLAVEQEGRVIGEVTRRGVLARLAKE